jgi:ribosome hibernation promoting factor
MQLRVKGRNLDLTPALLSYAERKIGRLDKLLAPPTRVEVELTVERNPSIAENQIAEATVWTKGPVLRARHASRDMKAAIDELADKLERQVERYRDKRTVERRREASRSKGTV